MYTAEFEAVAVTVAQDFFELQPADDVPVIIHAVYLSQTSDVGDAAEEILRIKIQRGATTVGSGGTDPTPVALEPGNPSADTTVQANNTTEATSGTVVDIHSDAFNIRTGWQYIPTPEMRPVSTQAEGFLTITLMAAPADSLTMSGTVYFEEIG